MSTREEPETIGAHGQSAMGSISVVIPARNMAAYIGEAIDSALRQTPAPMEVIVVDDKSSDDTVRVAEERGPRVRILSGPGAGPSIARNLGMLAARGDWVAFLDADDLWLPGKLSAQLDSLVSSGADLCFTDYYASQSPDVLGDPWVASHYRVKEGDLFDTLLVENYILTSSLIFRRSLLALSGLFKPKLRAGEDHELWLRLAKHGRFSYVSAALVFKREHTTNITGDANYAYFYPEKWAEVAATHRDVSDVQRATIREQVGNAYYAAGRHAISVQDRARAIGYLRESIRNGSWWSSAGAWWAVALLPRSVLSRLLSVKRTLTGNR